MITLEGQHIFVVGGSRGIGRAVAILAADAGANVSIGYHSDKVAAKEVCSKIQELGRKSAMAQCDIAIDGEVKQAMADCCFALGPINGVCVAAGIFKPTPIDTVTTAQWDDIIDINLRGTFHSVRDCLPFLTEASASIVIIASTAGQTGSSVFSAYATSKGAQMNFMWSMAKELGPRNIRVNCVAPAWTETDLAKSTLDELGRDNIIADIPLGRIGRAEDAGYATCFLLSPIASLITGSTITVDGGYHMRG